MGKSLIRTGKEQSTAVAAVLNVVACCASVRISAAVQVRHARGAESRREVCAGGSLRVQAGGHSGDFDIPEGG